MSADRGFVSETPIRVRYAETDAMGVVHHSAYVVWFEVGRSDWLRQRGPSYAELEAAGHFLPVTELWARFVAPAHYDKLVTVRTWVDELRSRQIRFAYEVSDLSGRTLVVGRTTHLCTTRDGRVVAIPASLRELARPPRSSKRRGAGSSGERHVME